MAGTGRYSRMPTPGRWIGLVGLFAVVTPRPGLGQQSAAVHATVRVVVSAAAENRALVAELVRRWTRRTGPMWAQGSLALVRLRVVGSAAAGRSVTPGKPAAIIDVHYLRN